MSHVRPRLNLYARSLIIQRTGAGLTQAAVAEQMGVSRATVCRWVRRYREEGLEGLKSRTSRPLRCPRAIPPELAARVIELRRKLGVGPHQIAARLKMPPSTVYRVLKRAGLSVLAHLDRTTREVIRYERERPGELLHLDVKKLRRIPPGGGRRKDPEWFITNTSYRIRGTLRGQDFMHVAVDDHSRYAYVEALKDEKAVTTEGFLRRAVAEFKAKGVKIEHLISDNGSNYTSKLFKQTASDLGICLHRTRPYHPQTNGKAEAFIKTLKREWAYARIYTSNRERLDELSTFLNYYNHNRPHTSLGLKPPAERM